MRLKRRDDRRAQFIDHDGSVFVPKNATARRQCKNVEVGQIGPAADGRKDFAQHIVPQARGHLLRRASIGMEAVDVLDEVDAGQPA